MAMVDSYHTPQSLRDSSSILEEQPDIQLFIFVELTLYNTLLLTRDSHNKGRRANVPWRASLVS